MPRTLEKQVTGLVAPSRARVTSKGQITLPSALRKRLGILPGDSVLFKTKGDAVVMVPQRRAGVFEEFRGSGTDGAGANKGAILAWVREFRGDL